MKTVYVVTDGSWSDYGIEAIFSTKKRAAEYRRLIGANDVEEWDMDTPKREWHHIKVGMARDGEVVRAEENVGIYTSGFCYFDWHPREKTWWEDISNDDKILVWGVGGSDIKRAIKVVNEKRAIILAHNIWGKSDAVEKLFNPASSLAQSPEEGN